MKSCTAALGSLTLAIKANSVLASAGINAKIVKLTPSMTRRGCAYDIEYFCEEHKAVRSAFNTAKISVSSYIKGDGGETL